MTRRTGIVGGPNGYIASGGWPEGELVADVPVPVLYARDIALRLRDAISGTNVSELADAAAIARSTIYDILAGHTWPDVVTLAKLETELGVRLWPDEGVGH